MTIGPRRNALKIENISVGVAAIGLPVAIRTLAVTLIMLGGLVFEFAISPACAQSNPAIELEAAVSREQVYGDLAAAVASYQKIAADLAAPRSVRARALLHLAGCYEKLGKQAQTIYQQIVREFGGEPAAVQARARLVLLREGRQSAPFTMTQSKVEIPGGSFRPQATDGHRMVYRDEATGDLIYSDAATKTRRVIFKTKPDEAVEWLPSRDFSIVALAFREPAERAFVALVQINGKGYRELVRIGMDVDMVNWSWDNHYLLVATGDRRVLVISTTTGERRELVADVAGDLQQCAFSPDGRFVACKFDQKRGIAIPSRILVWRAQGGEPHLIREEADPYLKFFDWTADGHYLAIGSSHTGKAALHLLPVKDGQVAGEPILVQFGAYEDASITKAGTLVYQKAKPGGLWTIHVATMDPNGRPGSWQTLERPGENPTNPWPHWSPDSNQIVYTARDLEGEFGNAVVRVRNLATGADREIYRSPGHAACIWGVRQPTIFCSQWTASTAILSIAPESGQVVRLGGFPETFVMLLGSSKDGALYLWRTAKEKGITTRWEIATGQETILMEGPAHYQGDVRVSPDERWMVRTKRSQLDARLTSGGDWKFLASTDTFEYAITQDGKWVVYHGSDSAGNPGLFRVPITGGPPERLGLFPTKGGSGTMEISPDGRRVVNASYDYKHGFELWALDHFVPAPSPAAR